MTQPTTGYSDDEVQAVVSQLILSSVPYTNDTLGTPRTDLTFNGLQQAAAAVFVLQPNAPFYCLLMGLPAIQAQLTAEAATVQSLLAAISASGRNVLPVDSVSTLFGAQAALQTMSATVRTNALAVTSSPAYQQLSANLNSFLSGPGQGVKQNGQIVQTPQQASSSIPSLASTLSTQHAQLVASIQLFVNALTDYAQVQLPAAVAESVLSNAAALLGQTAATMSPQSPTERLSSLRQAVLQVLAVQAAVPTFGAFASPSDVYALTGIGMAYSDAAHAATPAIAVATSYGGVAVQAGVNDTLSLALDGGTPVSVALPPSTIASVTATTNDSMYTFGNGYGPIEAGAAVPNNNVLKLRVNATPYSVTLPLSTPYSSAQLNATGDPSTPGWYGSGGLLDGTTFEVLVNGQTPYTVTLSAPTDSGDLVTQINDVTNASGNMAGCAVVSGVFYIATGNVGPGATLLLLGGTALSVLGYTAGQSSQGGSGSIPARTLASTINAALGTAGVTASASFSPLKYTGEASIPGGTGTTWTFAATDLVALGVQVGDAAQVLSGASAGFYPITAVTSTSITVSGTTTAQTGAPVDIGPVNQTLTLSLGPSSVVTEDSLTLYGDDPVSQACLQTFGFANGALATSQQTTPDQVAAFLTQTNPSLTAAASFIPLLALVRARTDLTLGNQVTFARGSVTAALAATPSGSFTATLSAAAGSVSPGDVLVIRSGASTNQSFLITEYNGEPVSPGQALSIGDVLTAQGAVAVATGVTAEVGPSLAPVKYDEVQIQPGSPNAGSYFVLSSGETPIDVLLTAPLQVSTGSPTPLFMVASYGKAALSIASSNTTVLSQVTVSGDAAASFFSPVPFTALATSPWFQLPSTPANLSPGDILELHATDYRIPSETCSILQVESSSNLIQVSPDVQGATPWSFSPRPPPFALLRAGVPNTYGATQAALDTWLANPTVQPLFFSNLNALLNPLVASGNPTAVQVATASAAVTAFSALLTGTQSSSLQSILSGYTVEAIPSVTSMVQSFQQQGADKAVDTLLSGQFSAFFAMSEDDTSYAGAMQSAIRQVAQNDLPISKYSRAAAQTSPLTASVASPDLEYTANSTDPAPTPDPPILGGPSSTFGTTID